MQKIILGSLKAVVRNMELVLIIFLINITVKYLFQSINEINFFYLVISITINLYIVTATLKALCQDEKFGKWNWRDYFIGAVRNLPFIIIWILSIVIIINAINFILITLNLNHFIKWNAFIFWLLVYLTSAIPIAITAGKSVKESFITQLKIIKRDTLKWVFSGIYIFIIVQITSVVVFTLWENAIKFKGNLLGTSLVLAGEMVKSTAAVVVLSTAVGLLFSSLEKKIKTNKSFI